MTSLGFSQADVATIKQLAIEMAKFPAEFNLFKAGLARMGDLCLAHYFLGINGDNGSDAANLLLMSDSDFASAVSSVSFDVKAKTINTSRYDRLDIIDKILETKGNAELAQLYDLQPPEDAIAARNIIFATCSLLHAMQYLVT